MSTLSRTRWVPIALAVTGALSSLLAGCGGKGMPNADAVMGDAVITPDRPTSRFNLEVTQVATQASRVDVGETVNVAFEVENTGELAVGEFQVLVALAREEEKIPLMRVSVPGLEPSKRYSSPPLDLQIPLDVRSGQYFLIAEADPENLVEENDEMDNLGKTLLPLQIVNPLIPDLIIVKPKAGAAVQLSQNSVIPGSPVNVRFSVKNVGMMPVLSFTVGLYLSSDTKVDKGKDMPFGTIPVSALAGEEEKELSMTLNLPADLPFGNYYVLANADDGETVEEGDESDNVGASDILTVRMPPDHFTDLIATDVQVRNNNPVGNQTTFYYGDRMEVEATFKNLGDIAAKFFATRVFLSLDRNFDPPVDNTGADGGPVAPDEDILLTTFNTQGLLGNQETMQTKSREISNTIPTGSYYIILQVDSDNTVDESDFEGNNLLILDNPITISGDPPPPANDTCSAAQPLTFDAAGVAVAQQSNEFALADYAGSCGGGSGRDLVYSFTTTVPRSLRVNVSGFDAVVYLRKGACATAMDQGLCASGRDLYLKNLDPGSYSLFVDGSFEDEFGPFTLTVTQAAPVEAAYTFSTIPAAMTDISTTGMLVTPFMSSFGGANNDSGCANDLPIGFTFPFFENNYTTVQVHADGYVRFGATSCNGHTTNQELPDPSAPNNIAAGFWDDLGFSTFGAGNPNAKVFVQAMGDRYIVQYTAWPIFGDDTSSLNFQIILHLNGNLEYQYGSMVDTEDPMRAMGGTSSGASIGLENMDGSDGYQFSLNSAVITGPMGILVTKAP